MNYLLFILLRIVFPIIDIRLDQDQGQDLDQDLDLSQPNDQE